MLSMWQLFWIQSTSIAVHRRSHSGEKLFQCRPLLFAASDLDNQVTLLCTAEFTVVRNHTKVTCVTRHLVSLEIWTSTWESTHVTKHTTVHCV